MRSRLAGAASNVVTDAAALDAALAGMRAASALVTPVSPRAADVAVRHASAPLKCHRDMGSSVRVCESSTSNLSTLGNCVRSEQWIGRIVRADRIKAGK